MSHYFILGGIMLFAGILGGFINFYRDEWGFYIKERIKTKLILSGIGASFLVPLFLNTISSGLLESSKERPSDYFIIAGFCLVSAILSYRFIDSIGEVVMKKIKTNEERIDKITTVVNEVKEELDVTNTEGEIDDTKTKIKDESIDNDSIALLEAFTKSKFAFRSVFGLAKQVNREIGKVRENLEDLQIKGYVIRVMRKPEVFRWQLTGKGKELVSGIVGEDS